MAFCFLQFCPLTIVLQPIHHMKKLLLLTLFAGLFACQKNDNFLTKELSNDVDDELKAAIALDMKTFNYQAKLPNYLVTMGLEKPSIDGEKVRLGRVVFYDKSLSLDGKISCASCHKQDRAFADNVAFSEGVNGQKTTRNSMTLTNVANFAAHYTSINGKKPGLLWDGRAAEVVNQAPMAFANPHEMGLTMNEVVEKARAQDYYPYLMTQAYGDPNVTEVRLLESLQEFVRAMGSANSKLDFALEKVNGDLFGTTTTTVPITVKRDSIISYYYGTTIFVLDTIGLDTVTKPLLNFSPSELRGRTIFASNCTKCHTPIRSLQQEFMACNGLDMNYADKGLGGVTGNPADDGVFKSPSLRNIALTAPYMHDGRFKTLEEVVNFYSTGMKSNANLHPFLRNANGQALAMNFSAQEKKDLIAFLRTMTSYDVLVDIRFSNPFR